MGIWLLLLLFVVDLNLERDGFDLNFRVLNWIFNFVIFVDLGIFIVEVGIWKVK